MSKQKKIESSNSIQGRLDILFHEFGAMREQVSHIETRTGHIKK